MLSPSSSRRRSRRGGDWTYGTDNTGQVLWYCPPGGNIRNDRCGGRVHLQEYYKKKGQPYPSEMFTFKLEDVPPTWIQINAEGDRVERENGGSAGARVGAGAGGNEETLSLPPAVGEVRM